MGAIINRLEKKANVPRPGACANPFEAVTVARRKVRRMLVAAPRAEAMCF
jgi:hypothetical protein